jgi:hypothetical protein
MQLLSPQGPHEQPTCQGIRHSLPGIHQRPQCSGRLCCKRQRALPRRQVCRGLDGGSPHRVICAAQGQHLQVQRAVGRELLVNGPSRQQCGGGTMPQRRSSDAGSPGQPCSPTTARGCGSSSSGSGHPPGAPARCHPSAGSPGGAPAVRAAPAAPWRGPRGGCPPASRPEPPLPGEPGLRVRPDQGSAGSGAHEVTCGFGAPQTPAAACHAVHPPSCRACQPALPPTSTHPPESLSCAVTARS